MARLGSGHFQRSRQAVPAAEDGVGIQQQRKASGPVDYPVDRMCQAIDNIVANLTRQIDSAKALSAMHANNLLDSSLQGKEAKQGRGAHGGSLPSPSTLGESLIRTLLPANLLQGGKLPENYKLTADQCRHVLTACSKLLPAPMRFDPTAYNKPQPDQPDATDHDPTIPQTYLKHIAAALTLVVASLPTPEARIVNAVLEGLSGKIAELDPKNLGPTVVASKPGDKMNYSLGSYFPPNPMSPPLK
jgi:hypothetical protein